MNSLNVGIFGGTFDPIHYGHLILSEYVCDALDLHKVIFMPTGDPPHKIDQIVTKKEHRLNMTKLAIEGNSRFDISLIELERSGKSYTVDTLKVLEKEQEGVTYHFIIGADSLFNILTWRNSRELLNTCNFIVVNRAEYSKDELLDQKNFLEREYTANIKLVEIPNIEISSSEIRDRVKENKSIKYLTPKKVEAYIHSKNLYN